MSKSEILAELSALSASDRAEVFERLCELQEADLLRGEGPTAAERQALDDAATEFERDGDVGEPWRDVIHRLRSSSAT